MNVFVKPGFDAATLVVVGATTFLGEVIAGFKAIDKEVADVIAAFLEGLYEFLVVGHICRKVPFLLINGGDFIIRWYMERVNCYILFVRDVMSRRPRRNWQMFLPDPVALLSWHPAKVKKACIKVKGIEWCVFHKIMV